MDLATLTTKHKRFQDWSKFLQSELLSESLRLRTEDTLKAFRNVLAKCWESENVTPEDAQHIEDLERQLEQLNEEARLVAGNLS